MHLAARVDVGSTASANRAGRVRNEGKECAIHHGDVVEFRFNVERAPGVGAEARRPEPRAPT